MEILDIHPSAPEPEIIDEARRVLRRGGVIVYPTDTCYGLGCDARNERAKQRIASMKRRDEGKRFSVIVRDMEHAGEITHITDEQRLIISEYLPGPFTFILLNADFRILASNTLGVRIPDFAVTSAMAKAYGEPFITTSANISGASEPYSCHELNQGLLKLQSGDRPDLVLNAGELPRNLPSTVVDLTTSPPTVIREGGRPFAWPIPSK